MTTKQEQSKRTIKKKSDRYISELRESRKKKYYIAGKEFIPEDDYILCNVVPDDVDLYFFAPIEYKRVYATENGAFYYIEQGKKHTEARIFTKEEALDFVNKNSAYICTVNYDKIFGKPARG